MAAYVQSAVIPSHNRFQLCEREKEQTIQDTFQKEVRYGRGPHVINGVPVSSTIYGCCNKDPCFCRSDVIFYDGVAYDQKPFIQGSLRTRPGNVMYFEGKMVGPFNPGKSPLKYGPNQIKVAQPKTNCYNSNKGYGQDYNPCCTSSVYGDTIPPYANTQGLAFTKQGLPHGNIIGYFRFKPERICYDRDPTVQRIEQCCMCEPFEYDASQYLQDECPGKTCC